MAPRSFHERLNIALISGETRLNVDREHFDDDASNECQTFCCEYANSQETVQTFSLKHEILNRGNSVPRGEKLIANFPPFAVPSSIERFITESLATINDNVKMNRRRRKI